MKKLREVINRPLIFALLLNAGALFVSLIIYKPFFEENDDAFLSMIAEGAYGVRESHLIYTNIILGKIYTGLYSVCSIVRWHSLLQYCFLFISFTLLTYVLLRYKYGRIISCFIVLSSFYETYVSVQYSKSATIISVIGYIVLFIVLKDYVADSTALKGENRILVILAYILLIYGMLLRDSSFFLATLFIIPVGIYSFIKALINAAKTKELTKGRAGILNILVKYVAFFVPVLLLLMIFMLVNKSAYNSDEKWKSFMTYNDTRMELLDYRYDCLDYVKYGESLKDMGITENDAILYLTWQFGDDTVLSTDAMRNILDNGGKRKINTEFFKAFVKSIYDDCFVVNPLIFGMLIFTVILFMLLFNKKHKAEIILAVTELVIFLGILMYYQYSGRWSHRIVYAALLVFPVVYGLIIAKEAEDDYSVGLAAGAVSVILVFTVIGALLTNRFDYNEWKRESSYRSFLAGLSDNEDTLYVADTFTFQRAYRFDVFKTYSEGELDNFVAVGSWFMNSPITKNITERFKYTNPYDALRAKSEKVVLVDNGYVNEKLEFLNEHYDGTYTKEDLGEEFGFNMYCIK